MFKKTQDIENHIGFDPSTFVKSNLFYNCLDWSTGPRREDCTESGGCPENGREQGLARGSSMAGKFSNSWRFSSLGKTSTSGGLSS
jgi:hypothetical protein